MAHLDEYFGLRNKHTLEAKEGVNYTPAALATMTPKRVADNITREIVNRMPVSARPFTVFDACAGIGGNTLSFAENPSIGLVYAFESRPDRRAMLETNLQAYGLSYKVGVGETFNGVPESPETNGSVVYFDPNWLPLGVDPATATTQQYLMSGIRFGPYTLETWAERLTHCSLLVYCVPPGYRFGGVRDIFKVEIVDLRKSRLVILSSTTGLAAAEQRGIATFNAQAQAKLRDQDSQEWISAFQAFIYQQLARIIPDEQARVPYVGTYEVMRIWLNAFTHQSFDLAHNYEQLETLGDRALEFAFTRYLMRKFPQITDSEITQLKRAYMSSKEHGKQQEYARRLGFEPYIRFVGLEVPDPILEDVFESFFGALVEVSDKLKDGLGMVNVSNFVASFFEEVGIDYTLATEGDKSIVHERFTQFHWGKPIEREEAIEGGVQVTVSLTPEALAYLGARGVTGINPVIGTGQARSKLPAARAAYAEALRRIESFGIQYERLEEERTKMLLRDKALAPYIAPVKARLTREGFVDFEFYTPKASTSFKATLVELYGVRRNGSKQLLRANIADTKENGQLIVLSQYAAGL